MATQLLFAKTGVAAFRLYSLRRTLQVWFEELNRALAAAHRYDQLRISCGSGNRATVGTHAGTTIR